MSQLASVQSAKDENFHNAVQDIRNANDPFEKKRLALEKIDNAPFGWSHLRTIIVAGVGFFTDSYDIFAINIATTMMGYVFFHDRGSKLPSASDTTVKISTSAGTVVGQFAFGIIADIVGRKRIYGLELMIIIFATLAQALAGSSQAINFIGLITFWRVIMGIGIGGDYPLSSVIMSEFASTKWRGTMMAAVFSNQGLGQLTAALVALICTAGFKGSLEPAETATQCLGDCQSALDKSWRVLIGFGAVPACFALYFRLTIPETPRYSFDVSNNFNRAEADAAKFISGKIGDATKDDVKLVSSHPDSEAQTLNELPQIPKASFKDFCIHFSKWRHMRILIGTALSWFLLDVAFYGLGLNNSVILQTINYAGQANVYQNVYNTCVGNLILICAGSLPGYWLAIATVDFLGRKTLQLAGFTILTILFCIIGFGYNKIGENGLFGLYVLCQLFMNWGPNTTTFIVPGEAFPTRYRSTAHGISAASGKIGAIIAQSLIGPLKGHNCPASSPNCYLNHVMEIFALFMFLGIFSTLLIPETKRQSLEDLSEKLHGEVNYLSNGETTAVATPSSMIAKNQLQPRVQAESLELSESAMSNDKL